MSELRTLLLIPTEEGVGLSTTVMGLARALSLQGVKVCTFSPIYEVDSLRDRVPPLEEVPNFMGITSEQLKESFSQGRLEEVPDWIMEKVYPLRERFDVVVMQGIMRQQAKIFATRLNALLFRALHAQIILVSAPGRQEEFNLQEQMEITARPFGGLSASVVLGAILNKVNMPQTESPAFFEDSQELLTLTQPAEPRDFEKEIHGVKMLAQIPWKPELAVPRILDVGQFLNASFVVTGEASQRRAQRVLLGSQRLEHVIHGLTPGVLLIISGDRSDIIVAACLAALADREQPKIAGLLLTGEFPLTEVVTRYIQLAGAHGLPVFSVPKSTFWVCQQLIEMDQNIPLDDQDRIRIMSDFVSAAIDQEWLKTWIATKAEVYLTSVSFRYQLSERAKKEPKIIALPEGLEPRTLQAAAHCAQSGIARCVLFGNPGAIQAKARSMGITFGEHLRIVDPEAVMEKYVEPLVQWRAHKGMTPGMAREQLQDTVMLGTVMLKLGEVDGLVSGAEHTTANTIRPALQLIKTKPGVSLVSSIFFMCMPDQVLVFGDCAVNPNPTSEELADIAISSADSAKAFGILPRVAMISYSTGISGEGKDVDKVLRATQLVKEKRPDIVIDGPLQYDAALIPEVGASKAPNSLVAGKATVFIFPDLNTGNTTYKAVQRSANVLSIGPMLQGLAKPVNDLSRGASVEDIIYTIALTAIQAQS